MSETRAQYALDHGFPQSDPWFVLDIEIPIGPDDADAGRSFALMVEQGVRRRGLGYPLGPGVLSATFREISIDTPSPGMVISHYLWKLPWGTRFSLREK